MKKIVFVVVLIGSLFARRFKADSISLIIGTNGQGVHVTEAGALTVTNPTPITVQVQGGTIFAVSNGGPLYSAVTNVVIISNAYPLTVTNVLVTNVVNVKQQGLFLGELGQISVMDYYHQQTHDSNFYRVTYYNGSVANNGLVNLMFVYSNFQANYFVMANVGGEFTLSRFRSPIFTNTGRSLQYFNQNDYGPTNLTAYFFAQPIITNYGVSRGDAILIPGGNGAQKPGTQYTTTAEIIPQTNMFILLQFSNSSGGAAGISIELHFYREDD